MKAKKEEKAILNKHNQSLGFCKKWWWNENTFIYSINIIYLPSGQPGHKRLSCWLLEWGLHLSCLPQTYSFLHQIHKPLHSKVLNWILKMIRQNRSTSELYYLWNIDSKLCWQFVCFIIHSFFWEKLWIINFLHLNVS